MNLCEMGCISAEDGSQDTHDSGNTENILPTTELNSWEDTGWFLTNAQLWHHYQR